MNGCPPPFKFETVNAMNHPWFTNIVGVKGANAHFDRLNHILSPSLPPGLESRRQPAALAALLSFVGHSSHPVRLPCKAAGSSQKPCAEVPRSRTSWFTGAQDRLSYTSRWNSALSLSP